MAYLSFDNYSKFLILKHCISNQDRGAALLLLKLLDLGAHIF